VKDVPPSATLFRIRRILSAIGKLGCAAVLALSAAVFVSGLASPLLAQTTIGTGSIVGTVSDPSGGALSGATVSITNVATGQAINITTNFSGRFNSRTLIPGNLHSSVHGQRIRPCGGLSNRARG